MSKLEDTKLMIGGLAKLNESGIKIDNTATLMDIAVSLAMIADKLCEAESEEDKAAIKTMEQCSSEDYAIININGLDEDIRCAMCTNHMKNDRGCDGGCVVDENMYKRVTEVIERHMQKEVNNG